MLIVRGTVFMLAQAFQTILYFTRAPYRVHGGCHFNRLILGEVATNRCPPFGGVVESSSRLHQFYKYLSETVSSD